jgi:hypothetical protein
MDNLGETVIAQAASFLRAVRAESRNRSFREVFPRSFPQSVTASTVA